MKPIEQAYENGWTDLVMIGKDKKYPTFKGWQKFNMTDSRLAQSIEHGYDTYGMLAAYHPGVDIDITDVKLVATIRKLAFDMLGNTLVRTGSFPKCLLPYNTIDPFPKQWLKIWREGMDKPWLVEVLGDGQQYVLLGIHPETKEEYLWSSGSPLTTPIDDLPLIDSDMVAAFLQAVAGKFDPAVWTVKLSGAKTLTQTTPSSDTLAAPSIKDVWELVSDTPNTAQMGWDEMMNFGRAIKGATRGSAEGYDIFMEWCYSWEGGATDDDIIEKVWQGDPTVGWDWLMKLAEDHGASTITFDFPDYPSESVVESVVTNSSFTIDDVATADGVAAWMARNDFLEVAYNPIINTWYRLDRGRWVVPPGNHRGASLAYPTINRAVETLHAWLGEQPKPPKSKPRLKMLSALLSTPFADKVRTAMTKNGAWNIDVDTFDDPLATNHLLNTPEGTYDLDNYEMRAVDPLDYITKQTKVSPRFDNSMCPVWLDMLKRVTNNSDEIDYLQRYLGSALSGRTANKILLALYGPTNSCKSTITDTIATNVLGVGRQEYAAVAGENIILRRPQTNFDQHPTGLNTIRNSRFAISHEGGEGMRWSENVIKRLTGGDALSTRALFSDGDTKRFYGRLIATANLLPQTDFVDSGMRERMIIMRLNAIPDDERKDLRNVIEAEAPYILGWMIAGHHKNRERPVHITEYIPASILEETEEGLGEGDPVRAFISTVLVFNDDGDAAITTTAKLFEAYIEFWQSKGITNPIHTVLALGRALKDTAEILPYYHRTGAERGYRVSINTNAMKRTRDDAIDDLISSDD